MADKIGTVMDRLINMCSDYDIFESQYVLEPCMADTNLMESGMIDSMALLTIQGAIEEVFDVKIPKVVFIAELRSLRDIAKYLSDTLSAEKQRA